MRAVVDDGAHHAVGRVRDMSTSGLFVEGPALDAMAGALALKVGRKVAVVPLVGDLDGERLPAEVARVGDRGVAIRFVGLDADHRQRLRRIVAGDERPALAQIPRHVTLPLPPIPADAPVVLLTEEPASLPSSTIVTGDVNVLLRKNLEEMEEQLLEMARMKTTLLNENARLKREVMALRARNSLLMRVQDELLEAHEIIAELEQGQDAFVREIQRLELAMRRLASPAQPLPRPSPPPPQAPPPVARPAPTTTTAPTGRVHPWFTRAQGTRAQ